MTNFSFQKHRPQFSKRASRAMLVAMLGLHAISAHAQTLRPSTGPLRQSAPTFNRGVLPNVSAQRSADFIVAVVNSEPLTNNEVRGRLVRAEQQITQQGGALPSRAELAQQVLERLINDKAQLQAARLSGLRVDENSLQSAVQNVAQQNQLTVDALRQRLTTDGIAFAKFQGELRDELLVNRFRQREVDARVTITESEVDQFLREQDGGIDASEAEINLAQILIAVPEIATAAQTASLQAKAQQAFDKARSGADFAALASEFSDAPSRASGGVMGMQSAERYPTLFVDATKDLRAGGVAGLVRSGAGFHILKVIEKRQAGMASVNITQTKARHILLRVSAQQNEVSAKAKLSDAKKRIASGQAEFAAVARNISDDGSAKDGGDLGWANPGMFVPEFEQAMNSLSPGQVSEPLVSRFGVHLIQVMERRETKLSTKDQREMVRATLREKKQEEAYQLWAQEIRGRAYVEYREPPQ
jgi:peptidyl-prolyl cis-trans isomerase SurA